MPKFGSTEGVGEFVRFASELRDLLEDARVLVLERRKEPEQWAAASALLQAMVETADSMVILAGLHKTRDCFVLARSIVETAVNCCFILAGGEEMAKKARRHAEQKAYRDLDRELIVNGEALILKALGALPTPPEGSSLEQALNEYTTRRGSEVTSWTDESTIQRIEAVGKKYGEDVQTQLQFGLFGVYRHASEIIHGTLFGALFVLGFTRPAGPPKSLEDLEEHRLQLLSLALMMTGMAISGMVSVLAFELRERHLLERAAQALKTLGASDWPAKPTGS